MERDELIKKAAKAIAAFTDPEDWSAFRGEAEAALTVFEEAHAPTDDERKAIAQIILPTFDQLASAVYGDGPCSEAESALDAADLLIAAGFRRPVSGGEHV